MKSERDLSECINPLQLIIFFHGVKKGLLVAEEIIALEVIMNPEFVSWLQNIYLFVSNQCVGSLT